MAIIRYAVVLWMGQSLIFSVAAASLSDRAENPYFRIQVRNVFALVQFVPDATPPKPSPPLPIIKLTGITTILGDKRVLLKIRFPGTGREESCILSEGQSLDQITIVAIDEKAARVTVNNSGTMAVLTFGSDPR